MIETKICTRKVKYVNSRDDYDLFVLFAVSPVFGGETGSVFFLVFCFSSSKAPQKVIVR